MHQPHGRGSGLFEKAVQGPANGEGDGRGAMEGHQEPRGRCRFVELPRQACAQAFLQQVAVVPVRRRVQGHDFEIVQTASGTSSKFFQQV